MIIAEISQNVYRILDKREKRNENRLEFCVSVRELKPYQREIHSGNVCEDVSEISDSENAVDSDFDFDVLPVFTKKPNLMYKLTKKPIFRAPYRSNSSVGVPPPSRPMGMFPC